MVAKLSEGWMQHIGAEASIHKLKTGRGGVGGWGDTDPTPTYLPAAEHHPGDGFSNIDDLFY